MCFFSWEAVTELRRKLEANYAGDREKDLAFLKPLRDGDGAGLEDVAQAVEIWWDRLKAEREIGSGDLLVNEILDRCARAMKCVPGSPEAQDEWRVALWLSELLSRRSGRRMMDLRVVPDDDRPADSQ